MSRLEKCCCRWARPAVPDSNFPLTPQMTLQGYLTKLDMGNLVSTGMLSVNVLFSNDIQVRHIPAHTALHMGIS